MTARLTPLLLIAVLGGCGGTTPKPAAPGAVSDGIPLGAVPKQTLATGECGVFLWKTGAAARLVLVAKSGPPPFARMLLDGRLIDLPRIGDGGATADANTRYGDGRVTVSLDLTIEARRGLTDGAIVRGGSLRIDRTDGDGFVLAVSGLLACG